jgi:hypothetical protein
VGDEQAWRRLAMQDLKTNTNRKKVENNKEPTKQGKSRK